MLRFLECCAWSVGCLGLVFLASVKIQAHTSAHSAMTIDPQRSHVTEASWSGADDSIIGRLEIARIGMTVPILEGFNPRTLTKGVGHIRGTALPGGLGNMALAGHRDTYFRPLRNIRKGMMMSVVTPTGRFDYEVDSTEIVKPEQVSVLSIHDKPQMTLITCYPFEFIGSAPNRFIVSAHLRSVDPD